jgi:hypothetical protein
VEKGLKVHAAVSWIYFGLFILAVNKSVRAKFIGNYGTTT